MAARHWLACSLGAGGIAIGGNTVLLSFADRLGVATAHGGLLRLTKDLFRLLAPPLGLSALWLGRILSAVSGPNFQVAFHVTIGLLMAAAYAAAIEPAVHGRAWVNGLRIALAMWILNAAVVLPLSGEGFAGSRHLVLPEMLAFAFAHTVFFVTLAVLYA